MSSTNCFLPSKGFCLNLRVRIVNSNIAARRRIDKPKGCKAGHVGCVRNQLRLEPIRPEPNGL